MRPYPSAARLTASTSPRRTPFRCVAPVCTNRGLRCKRGADTQPARCWVAPCGVSGPGMLLYCCCIQATGLFLILARVTQLALHNAQSVIDLCFDHPFSHPLTAQIEDGSRSFEIVKGGFSDAVVWNPWVDKAAKMADFGDDEYKVRFLYSKTETLLPRQPSVCLAACCKLLRLFSHPLWFVLASRR